MNAGKFTSLGSSDAPIVNVVDGDASERDALASLFDSACWQVRTFALGRDFLASPRVLAPSCLILEVMLPDLGGLELQQQVANRPELPIIFITRHNDVLTTVRAMKAGAYEFLTKPVDSDYLLGEVRSALEHSSAQLAQDSKLQELRERHGALTTREKQVMALVVAGYLNKQVGAELQISEITVKAHRGRVMRKMQAHSLAHLISMAAQLRLPVAARAERARVASFAHAFAPAARLTMQSAARF